LEARADAVVSGNRAAFLRTVSRDSPSFVQRQRQLFDALEGVDLARYRLKADWGRYGDLAGDFPVGHYAGAEAIALPVTVESLRIRGFDPRRPLLAPDMARSKEQSARVESAELFYTFVRRRGEWKIAEDTDLERFGFLSARHLWDSGPVVATRSEHFLLLQHSCDAPAGCIDLPDDLLALAEEALRRVTPYWREPWSKKVVILAPSSEAQLQRMLGVSFDVSSFVAFAFGTSAPRIVVNPASLEGRSDESLLTILTHELLHVATRPDSGRFTPLFVEEGFADYVARSEHPDELGHLHERVTSGEFEGTIPQDFEFTTGTDIFLNYQESQSAIAFFIERWGLRKFVRFYKRLGAIDVAAGTSGYHVDAVFQKTLGIGFEEFEERWADSLSR
jgi:hypothetical protein